MDNTNELEESCLDIKKILYKLIHVDTISFKTYIAKLRYLRLYDYRLSKRWEIISIGQETNRMKTMVMVIMMTVHQSTNRNDDEDLETSDESE